VLDLSLSSVQIQQIPSGAQQEAGLEASGAEDGTKYESNYREGTVYQIEALWLQLG